MRFVQFPQHRIICILSGTESVVRRVRCVERLILSSNRCRSVQETEGGFHTPTFTALDPSDIDHAELRADMDRQVD